MTLEISGDKEGRGILGNLVVLDAHWTARDWAGTPEESTRLGG